MDNISAKANVWEFISETFVASAKDGLPTVLNKGWFRRPRRPTRWVKKYIEISPWWGANPERYLRFVPEYRDRFRHAGDVPIEIYIPPSLWAEAEERREDFLRTHVLREEFLDWEEAEYYNLPEYSYRWEKIG